MPVITLDIKTNPTRAQFEALINATQYGEIRGIISDSEGSMDSVFIADAGARCHDVIAKQSGVEYYTTFTISKGDDDDEDDFDYAIDNYNAYHRLKFLQKFTVVLNLGGRRVLVKNGVGISKVGGV